MKVAFDLDGTLGANPKELGELAQTLLRGGADVLVLTAAAGELPTAARPAEVHRRLCGLGLGFLRAVCIEQKDKAEYCCRNGVAILIDDTPFDLKNGTIQLLAPWGIGRLSKLLM